MSDFGQTTATSGGTEHGVAPGRAGSEPVSSDGEDVVELESADLADAASRVDYGAPGQNVAIGFSGDPMPCSMRSGAAVKRNS